MCRTCYSPVRPFVSLGNFPRQGGLAMKRMTLTAALKDYFAPDQKASEFLQELKKLTPEDKQYFRNLLPSVGYEIIDAMAA
jgi:hypothetical protein